MPAPKPPPRPFLQALGYSLKRLQMRHHRAANAGLADLGITIVQWDALRHLDENPGASLHALAQLTYQSDQAFGTLATRMIERGLIERKPGPGRAVRHELTAKGRALRHAGDEILNRVLAQSFAVLSNDQRRHLSELLELVLADEPGIDEASD